MRIRSIRPEFWSSEDVARMDWDTRLVFIGLWSYVDDNGVGRDIERLITTALFPLDDDLPESSRRVTGALRHLSEHGQITRYTVDGKAYLHISSWSKHQRIEKASAGRYPLPTCDNAEIQEPSRNTPGALPEPSTPGEGEKGRRGEVETPPASATAERRADVPDGFAEWWNLYPRKKDKGHAVKAYRAALRKVSASDLIAGLRRDLPDLNRREPDKVPYAATWLNGERWEDEAPLALVRSSEHDGIGRRLTLAEMSQPGWRPAGDVR
jgi:hypothetical protein